MSDKDLLIAQDLEFEGELPTFPLRKRKNTFAQIVKKVVLIYAVGYVLTSFISFKVPENIVQYFSNFAFYGGALDSSRHLFEIQSPLNPIADIESQSVLNSTFKDGLSGLFSIDNATDFDGAFVTLNVSSDSVIDKPVVFEISIGEHPVWRTSLPTTNKSIEISNDKNISNYLSLLREDGSFTLTVVEGGNPEADVTLELTLTNSGLETESKNVSLESLFAPQAPATNVFALGNGKIFNLPKEDKFSVELPKLAQNSTAAKLELFASLTKDEIAYFNSDSTPVRYISIFVNDIFIGSIAPKPGLYHPESYSEDSSETFKPLVHSGNFAGLSYEIDLVSVLPLLWTSATTLDIVVQGHEFDYTPGTFPLPKHVTKDSNAIATEGWFVSGNVLSWESSAVNSSVGALNLVNSKELPIGFKNSPPNMSPWQPSSKKLFAKDIVSSAISSGVKLTLQDGSVLNYLINVNSTTTTLVSKRETSFKSRAGPPIGGNFASHDSTSISLVNSNQVKVEFINKLNNVTDLTLGQSHSYPINLDKDTKKPVVGPSTETSRYIIESKKKTKLNGKVVNFESVQESVSAAPLSNTVEVKFKNGNYKRSVEVKDGVIFSDSQN